MQTNQRGFALKSRSIQKSPVAEEKPTTQRKESGVIPDRAKNLTEKKSPVALKALKSNDPKHSHLMNVLKNETTGTTN